MIDDNLVQMLRCPRDHSPLHLAEPSLIQRVNEAIGRGEIRDGHDQKVTEPIEGGLVGENANRLYPVRGGIPTLVPDEALHLPF